MQCGMCREEAVTLQEYSGKYLCRRHFIEDIGAKAKHTIRSRGWLRPGDHIGIDFSGDCTSMALLDFLHGLFFKRRDIRITALVLNDGTGSAECAERFAEERGIPVERGSIPETEDPAAGRKAADRDELRSVILDRLGREHTMTKIATGYCLDDEAASLLKDFLRGDAGHIFRGGPGTGSDRLPVIAPFTAVARDDISLYGMLNGQIGRAHV
jgi:tRNA(Ile)-lysidine synthase TilS/MesJ